MQGGPRTTPDGPYLDFYAEGRALANGVTTEIGISRDGRARFSVSMSACQDGRNEHLARRHSPTLTL